MADQIINRYGDKVRVIARPPHSVIVQEWGSADWKDAKIFDRISDDSVWTNAREYAQRLAASHS